MLLTMMIASALATPTPANVTAAPPTVAMNSVAVATQRTPNALSPNTRYCVIDTLTGSRIRTKVCHTADEWIARDGAVPTGRITRR